MVTENPKLRPNSNGIERKERENLPFEKAIEDVIAEVQTWPFDEQEMFYKELSLAFSHVQKSNKTSRTTLRVARAHLLLREKFGWHARSDYDENVPSALQASTGLSLSLRHNSSEWDRRNESGSKIHTLLSRMSNEYEEASNALWVKYQMDDGYHESVLTSNTPVVDAALPDSLEDLFHDLKKWDPKDRYDFIAGLKIGLEHLRAELDEPNSNQNMDSSILYLSEVFAILCKRYDADPDEVASLLDDGIEVIPITKIDDRWRTDNESLVTEVRNAKASSADAKKRHEFAEKEAKGHVVSLLRFRVNTSIAKLIGWIK